MPGVLKIYGIKENFPLNLPDLNIGFLTLPGYRPPPSSTDPGVLSGFITSDYLHFFETIRINLEAQYLQDCMRAVDVFDPTPTGQKPSAFPCWGDCDPSLLNANEILIARQTFLLQTLLTAVRPGKIFWIPLDRRLNTDSLKQAEFVERCNSLNIHFYLISEAEPCFDASLLTRLEGMKLMGSGMGCALNLQHQSFHANPTLLQIGRLDLFNKPLPCTDPEASSQGFLNLPRPEYQKTLNPTNNLGIPDMSIIGESYFYYHQDAILQNSLSYSAGSDCSAVLLVCCFIIYQEWFAAFRLNTTDPSHPRFYKTFFYQHPELFVHVAEGTDTLEQCDRYSNDPLQCALGVPLDQYKQWNFISGLGYPDCGKWGRFRRYLLNGLPFPLSYVIDGRLLEIPPGSMTSWFIAESVVFQGTQECYCSDPAVHKTGSTPVIPVSCSDYCRNNKYDWGDPIFAKCVAGVDRMDGSFVDCLAPSLRANCYCEEPLSKVLMDDPSIDNCVDTCRNKRYDSCNGQLDQDSKTIQSCSTLPAGNQANPVCLCAGAIPAMIEKPGNDGNTTCRDFCGSPNIDSNLTFARCVGGHGIGGNIRKNFGCDDVPVDAYPLAKEFVCNCDQPAVAKTGNDGSVSCLDYCLNRGGKWGTAHSGCVAAKPRNDAGSLIDCQTIPQKTVDCYCKESLALSKPGADGTRNCHDFCRNNGRVVGDTFTRCARCVLNGRDIPCNAQFGDILNVGADGTPKVVVEDPTPIEQIQFFPVGVFSILWAYQKSGLNFDFPEEPVVRPLLPPTATILFKRRGNSKESYESRGTDICGSLIVFDSNRANSYNIVINHYKDLGGWARGLIPYVQIWNMTANKLDVEFWDQSATKTPSRMTLDPGAEDAFNMETGVRRSTEMKIVVPVAAALASALVVGASFWAGGATLVELQEAITGVVNLMKEGWGSIQQIINLMLGLSNETAAAGGPDGFSVMGDTDNIEMKKYV